MQGEIDGLRLCEQIKKSVNSCYVILLSGKAQRKAQQSDIDLGMQAGADVYKVKPFSPVELLTIVNNFIHSIAFASRPK